MRACLCPLACNQNPDKSSIGLSSSARPQSLIDIIHHSPSNMLTPREPPGIFELGPDGDFTPRAKTARRDVSCQLLMPATDSDANVRRDYRQQRNAYKVPFDQLPAAYDVQENPHAPRLCFGLEVTYTQFVDFAVHHHLITGPPPPPATWVRCAKEVLDYLRDQSGGETGAELSFALDFDKLVITLYSNSTMEEYRYSEEDEKDVIEVVQREFGTDEPFRWYWPA
ncbi:hypothetical protein FA95DRAFT_1558891 [Auriscalpium vulgare]|uniref:Uncharacterized protein n=1 Tax=Auriscalpium vulgare TaxID=40419 RepID=A0ACB8RU64_9AGAM|nr:hypothetical protein FA95DRAFT_1558891 [Auriscalpium vulgare]